MIKNIIAIYPGRFQPFGKHHAAAFKWLQKEFGAGNTYIATSNVVTPPKSPFTFKEKQDIISNYGFDDRLVQVKNPYKSEELLKDFDPKDTAVVFMVGEKDMKEDPRFALKPKKDGSLSYFQDYKKNKANLKGYDVHGYLVVAPHVSIKVPGYGEMSGTALRDALGAKKPRSQKVELFKSVFGWYNKKTSDMIFDKLEENINEMKLFSKDWWSESLELNEDMKHVSELKIKFRDFIAKIKKENKETKEAFKKLIQAAKGEIELTEKEKVEISAQLKEVLKKIGLLTLVSLPGGILAMTIIKVLKSDKYVKDSEKVTEAAKDKDDPCWKGYRQYGMKKKGNKEVPNCVPEQVEEGYMSPEQAAAHNNKIEKLKKFLRANIGREFAYNFNDFPKTVYGVNIQESLLMEGGAGGHMAHPFDVEWVKTGADLIDVFNMSINYLEKGPASVKIDGVNASIRLINLDGKPTFVMDRGSNKPLDVKGITKAELQDRFGAGHGMIEIGGKVLDIFNKAIPKIKPALMKLGLWDNPNILFNLEYVAGSTNVLSYGKNFIAVHGLLEIKQVSPTKRASKEINYNKAAMQDLLDNLAPTAAKFGYEVVGSIPTTLTSKPNLNSVLNKKYTVTFDASTKETKTLKQWLANAKVPNVAIKTVDNKSISALSKEVLVKISDGIPLDEFIKDTKDYQAAIDGFVIYMATMKLGDAILANLDSPLGPVSEHEGIVIRDNKISNKPFKITGRFILGGLASSFNK